MRVAVIGAGAGGLCAARHGLAAGHEVVVFEQGAAVGGTWIYTDHVGTDNNGLDIHSSMYKDLRTNLPKEIMCFPDFPFPKQVASYIPGTDVNAYLDLYADAFRIRDHIRFEQQVIRIRPISPLDSRSTWEVIVRDVVSDRYETIIFDAVMVCNGHYSVPHIPAFDGLERFPGRQMHSHNYRTPNSFKGKTVLVVGYASSGADIAKSISLVAQRVTVSCSTGATMSSDQISFRPVIRRFNGDHVEFVDGSTDSFSDVLFCTGYKYVFPFLSVDAGIKVEADSWVHPLFKQCINIEHPTMIIVGLVTRVCPFQVMDMQVRFFLSFLSDRRKLPTRSEMLAIEAADLEKRIQVFGQRKYWHRLDTLQEEYYNDLAALGDVENVKPYHLPIYFKHFRNAFDKNVKDFRTITVHIIDDHNFTWGSMLSE